MAFNNRRKITHTVLQFIIKDFCSGTFFRIYELFKIAYVKKLKKNPLKLYLVFINVFASLTVSKRRSSENSKFKSYGF